MQRLREVISDTTVQEKNISYPTDGKLLCRAIEHLVKAGKEVGIKFRQTYHKLAPQLRNKVSRLLHARKSGQAKKHLISIYTTNAIESVNSSTRKIIKNKKSFPSDNSVFKMLYSTFRDCAKKWTMPIRDWEMELNQFIIKFDLDISEINKW